MEDNIKDFFISHSRSDQINFYLYANDCKFINGNNIIIDLDWLININYLYC